MLLRISADTTLRVDTNHDGSLTLRLERKRPLEAETTSIEATEITDADVTADVTAGADNDAFTLKRHKTSVFDEKMALAKSLVAPRGNDARTTAIERMFIARCEEQPGDHLLEQHRRYFFHSFSAAWQRPFHRPSTRSDVPHDQAGKAGGLGDFE